MTVARPWRAMVLALTLPIALAGSVAGCAATPTPQALVWLDSDAPIPRMFDRLRIEVLNEAGQLACGAQCIFDEALTATTVWPLSFGVAMPTVATGVAAETIPRFVRVRLFPNGRLENNEPHPATAIDRIVALAAGEGVVTQGIFLPTACTGLAADPANRRSCTAEGQPAQAIQSARVQPIPERPGRIGTFGRETVRRVCNGNPRAAREGLFDWEICIPGGVFWMGDDRTRGIGPDVEGAPEHVVVLSPFYLDRDEYTVGRYMDALARGLTDPMTTPGQQTACAGRPLDEPNRCSFGPPPGCDPEISWCCTLRFDADPALPLSCVGRTLARRLCEIEGRRLPTEAEWEWAAGNLESETLYPWGDLQPGCNDFSSLSLPPRWDPTQVCTSVAPSRPPLVGSVPFDTTQLGVRGMFGGLQEWVDDEYQFYGQGCWSPTQVRTNPRCTDTGVGLVSRGRHFANERLDPIVTRQRLYRSRGNYTIGFRCARSDG